jgi:hypothetical protein
MARYEGETRLSAPDVMDRAERFFGPQGLGLTRQERGIGNALWEGGGGTVAVTAISAEHGTRVEVASQAWDRQAQDFVRGLPRGLHLPFS